MDSIKPVKVSGSLYWANWMKNYNTKFNEANDKYECTVGDLSDKACAALKELGINIKNKDGMGNYIVGKSKYVFEPVLEDGTPVEIERIGNGTKVHVLVSSYRHKMSAKFGAAPSIKKIIVTELVQYEAGPKEAEEEDDVL